MFAINIDIDWAPDAVTEFALDILDEFSAPATLFCTHEMNAATRGRELCIHPNFNNDASVKETIDSLRALYPGARGARGHGSYFSYYIAGLYRENGLLYDCSYYFPAGPVRPYKMFHGIMEIPYFFIDDLFFKEDGLSEPDLSDDPNGVKVFVFHPIHLFLNTETPQRYIKAKEFYHQPDKLLEFRNEGSGAQSFLRKLLRYSVDNNIPLMTMGEIYERFR